MALVSDHKYKVIKLSLSYHFSPPAKSKKYDFSQSDADDDYSDEEDYKDVEDPVSKWFMLSNTFLPIVILCHIRHKTLIQAIYYVL